MAGVMLLEKRNAGLESSWGHRRGLSGHDRRSKEERLGGMTRKTRLRVVADQKRREEWREGGCPYHRPIRVFLGSYLKSIGREYFDASDDRLKRDRAFNNRLRNVRLARRSTHYRCRGDWHRRRRGQGLCPSRMHTRGHH